MPEYSCELCCFSTKLRPNYERHLKSKKHIFTEKNACNPNVIPSNPCVSHEDSAKDYTCKYCGKLYKHRQSVFKHIKYSCKKNKDEDLKELVRLLNLQLQQKDNQIKKQQKQIDKLMDKLQVQHITTNQTTNHTNNIQNNIKIICYKDTDVSALLKEIMAKGFHPLNPVCLLKVKDSTL
jgi:hypothetical protein